MPQINQRQMLPVGTILDGRYRIVRYLASGGFGNTYVAEHLSLGGQVAIKEFFMRGTNHRSPDGTTVEVSNEENTAVFDAQLNKFRREARRIFELHNDHIIHVSDLFDANGTSYYVMDLIPGTSLAELTNQQPLSEQEARDAAMQVLDALEAMHAAGLYHLDVKPGNIMRDNHGHCTLIDFGASKQLTADERATLSSSSMAYTPGYAPMEQVAQHSKNIGPWTDFYALGATLYRLLTGNKPPEVAVNDFAPDGRQFDYPDAVSPAMRKAVSALMNPIHTLRPQTDAEVKALLEGHTPSEETVITAPTPETSNEETRYDETPTPPVSPVTPVSPTPLDSPDNSDSSNISDSHTPSQSIPDNPKSSGKKLWYVLAGLAVLALIVLGIITAVGKCEGDKRERIFQEETTEEELEEDVKAEVVTESKQDNQTQHEASPEEVRQVTFCKKILASTEDVWAEVFRDQLNREYKPPKIVFFTNAVQTRCGNASSAVGTFYCSADQKLYIDLSFFKQMENELGAKGEFARAYIIAREVGHHVEYLLGSLGKAHCQMQQSSKEKSNQISVRLELLADYYAGVWAHYEGKTYSSINDKDIESAIICGQKIGDDILTGGRVSQKEITHGTTKQRMRWLKRGIETGDMRTTTFNMDYNSL